MNRKKAYLILTLFSFEKSCIRNCFSGAHACNTKSIFETTFCVNELRCTRNTQNEHTDERKKRVSHYCFIRSFIFIQWTFDVLSSLVSMVVSIFAFFVIETEECSYCCHYHPLHLYNGFRFWKEMFLLHCTFDSLVAHFMRACVFSLSLSIKWAHPAVNSTRILTLAVCVQKLEITYIVSSLFEIYTLHSIKSSPPFDTRETSCEFLGD